jgi:hypothetical protein
MYLRARRSPGEPLVVDTPVVPDRAGLAAIVVAQMREEEINRIVYASVPFGLCPGQRGALHFCRQLSQSSVRSIRREVCQAPVPG